MLNIGDKNNTNFTLIKCPYLELWLSVTEMVKQLGWRSLEQRRADARLCLFCKVIHGLVAVHVPFPDYINYSKRISRYRHSMTFSQVSTSFL